MTNPFRSYLCNYRRSHAHSSSSSSRAGRGYGGGGVNGSLVLYGVVRLIICISSCLGAVIVARGFVAGACW